MALTHADFQRSRQTDPTAVYRYRDGIYAVDLLTAAIVHFDLLTWLDKNPSTLATICAHFNTTERPTDVLMTLLAANDLVHCDDGVFRCTLLAQEHLTEGAPWDMRSYYASLQDRPVARDMVAVLKTGKPANWSSSQSLDDWHRSMEKDDFARTFTAAMDCRGLVLGQALASQWTRGNTAHLLDIAGGSGIYGCCFAAKHVGLHATVFEKSPVDRIAKTLIDERGFSDRVSVTIGDMFKDAYPEGCDAHLLSNVLHDWDIPEVMTLLRKSFATLPSGGQLIIHDAFINREKNGPKPVAEYSTILMHSTQGKCYSLGEMEGYLDACGFVDIRFTETVIDRGCMMATKPH